MQPDRPESAAALWPPIARFIETDARIGAAAAARGRAWLAVYEFVRFGVKQGWACLFGGLLLALMIATRLAWPAGAPLTRYDALFVAALMIQAILLWRRLETWEEAKVILVFHVVGTVMEVHKTGIGSWIYPEASILRIGGVPLFTGFMYAAVGSYLARAWRLFDFRFTRHPPLAALTVLSAAIYANFLVDHTGYDLRLPLIATAVALFAPATIHFKVWRRHRTMPLLLGLSLVALFIWFAENVGTLTGTWLYPSQKLRWSPVPFAKFSSWFLLMIVSYTLVTRVNGIVPYAGAAPPCHRPRSGERGLPRAACLVGAGLVVAAGLSLRLPDWRLPLAVHHYGGGILWSAMLFLLVAALRPPRWNLAACATAAGSIAVCVEASRLLHAPGLDAFRTTLAGQLLLGRIYSGWNVLAYAVGIAAAAGAMTLLSRRRHRDRAASATVA